jgi:hypothetical protein
MIAVHVFGCTCKNLYKGVYSKYLGLLYKINRTIFMNSCPDKSQKTQQRRADNIELRKMITRLVAYRLRKMLYISLLFLFWGSVAILLAVFIYGCVIFVFSAFTDIYNIVTFNWFSHHFLLVDFFNSVIYLISIIPIYVLYTIYYIIIAILIAILLIISMILLHYFLVIFTLVLIYGFYLNFYLPESIWKRATFVEVSQFFIWVELSLFFLLPLVISIYLIFSVREIPTGVIILIREFMPGISEDNIWISGDNIELIFKFLVVFSVVLYMTLYVFIYLMITTGYSVKEYLIRKEINKIVI